MQNPPSNNLFSSACDVLKKDKKLLLFPILSGLSMYAFFFILNTPQKIAYNAAFLFVHNRPLAFVYFFALYFLCHFIIYFFNTALIACAISHLNDQNFSFGDGLAVACAKAPQLICWAMIASSIGYIFAFLERSRITRFIFSTIDSSISIMSMFVIPIMVCEEKGPLSAFEESRRLLSQCFRGRIFGKNYGFMLFYFPIYLGGIYILNYGLKHGMNPLEWGIFGAAFGTIVLLEKTITLILDSAIYLSLTGNLRTGFTQAQLAGALRREN